MQTYFGFICPKCHSTVDLGVETPNCPSCGTQMVPNPNGKPVGVNVSCKNCNSAFGMIDSDKCPGCGTPFE